MTVYWIDYDVCVLRQMSYDNISNLMSFYEEMDNIHQEGWYDNIEDAEEELQHILECEK